VAVAHRIRPLEAHRAMRALLADPDDTEKAFRVIGALSGNSTGRGLAKFRRLPVGARMLRDRTRMLDLIADDERMAAMPAGSLGAAVRDFYATEQISAKGLVAASEEAYEDVDSSRVSDDVEFFGQHLRDLHDTFHVLTGYGRDVRGEVAVLSFTVPQTRNPGIAFLVFTVLRRAGFRSEMGRLIRQGFQRGLRAAWLPGQDWPELFEQPLEEVRERLRLGSPREYEAVRSEGAPVLADGS
jgi:ubiquinone biosynthesis protein COQ4